MKLLGIWLVSATVALLLAGLIVSLCRITGLVITQEGALGIVGISTFVCVMTVIGCLLYEGE